MSSTTAADRPAWSLAARLAVWYAAAGFALVAAATGHLYWGLTRTLDHEDDLFLADKVRAVRRVLADRPEDAAAVRQEVLASGADRGGRFFIRVIDKLVGEETPGMGAVLPPDIFPPADPADRAADFRTPAGRPFRLRAARENGIVVQAAMDRAHDDEMLAEYRTRVGSTLAVCLVAAAAGGYLIARRGVRPLAEVAAAARRTGPTRLEERIATAGLPAEVRDLAVSFNRMLDRLEDAFARLGRFSADIAHELRSPVNNLRAEAEVALTRPRTPGEYREVLGSCLEECGRLARLIDGLLFLARADDPKTELARRPVDVGAELCAVRAAFDATAADAGVRLDVDAEPGLVVPADRDLVQRAVGNLVSNALAHTPAGGRVTLFAGRAGGGVRFGVRDTGGGIPAEHLPRVFDRFYRADPARGPAGGRVGLGLAIVKGIAELHGGTAEAECPPAGGTAVAVTLPQGGSPAG